MTRLLSPLCAALAPATLLAACTQAPAELTPLAEGSWSVDAEASSLSYVSVKSGEIAEPNTFSGLSGSVSPDGTAALEIDLASLETGVDIRNERMRDIFFEVADHPAATITAKLDPAAFGALAMGESTVQPLKATLTVKGIEAPVDTKVTVTRIAQDRVLATSTEPVIVYADALELTEGLAQLQELAGLPSITPAVPVTFTIVFER
ncbi:MAG: YceI family protein [Pseudomonadota bacterium]